MGGAWDDTCNKYEMKSLSGRECGVVSAAHRHRHMVVIPACLAPGTLSLEHGGGVVRPHIIIEMIGFPIPMPGGSNNSTLSRN